MKPVIDHGLCTRCGLCVTDCVAHAIHRETFTVIEEKCILCSHCTAICPTGAVTLAGVTGDKLGRVPENSADVFEYLIKKRRSIRQYKPQVLPYDLVQKILEITNHSPTGTNSRGVSITVFNDFDKMKKIADTAMKHYRLITNLLLNPLTYPVLLPLLGLKKLRKFIGYKKSIAKYFEGKNNLTHNAPALFIFHVSRTSSCPSEDGVIWASTALLACESLGIGTCYNGFLVRAFNTNAHLRKLAGIPRGNRVYETFTAGFPAVSYKRQACVPPVNAVINP